MASMRRLLLLVYIGTGCSGQPEALPMPEPGAAPDAEGATPEAPPTSAALDIDMYGWISEVVLEPGAYERLTQSQKEGWEAFENHAYEAAAEAFNEPVSRSRAEWSLALLHEDLARLSGYTNESFFAEWDARTSLPNDSAAAVVASLASFCAESGSLAGWASRTKMGTPGFEMAQAISRGRAPWDVEGTDVFAKRMALHRETRVSGDYLPLKASGSNPLVVERTNLYERVMYDPCLHRTLADHWYNRAAISLGGKDWKAVSALVSAGLTGRVFAPWLTQNDLATELRVSAHAGSLGARSPSLRKLGVGTNPHAGDLSASAEDEITSLDQGLAVWKTTLKEQAPPQGLELLESLELIERFRNEWLVTRARYALLDDRSEQAGSYLAAAHRADRQSIDAASSPHLWVLTAHTALLRGDHERTKEALNVIVEAYPEVVALQSMAESLMALRTQPESLTGQPEDEEGTL